jgi:ankyrin repeat protein
MAIKATALLTEFFMLLSATTTSWNGRFVKGDKSKAEKLKIEALRDLKKADEGVMHNLKILYKMQGRLEECKELVVNDRANNFPLEELRGVLGQDELHFAAMDSSHTALELFLYEKDEDQLPKSKDIFGRTSLHYAACRKNQNGGEIYKKLLRIVGNRDAEDRYGMTALLTAAERGNVEMVEVLLEDGANKDGKLQEWTALHIAAEKGHLGVVEKLLNVGVDSTLKTPSGWTALHLAVLGCHCGVISKMVERHFNPGDSLGMTALHLIAQSNRVEEMLESENGSGGEGGEYGKGPEREKKGEVTIWLSDFFKERSHTPIPSSGKTVLHLAAERGYKRMVSLFSKSKNLIVVRAESSKTALHLAAENGHKAVVQQLLEIEGVEPNSKDEYGQTPLSLAAEKGHVAVVRLLLEIEGVELNSKDNSNWTPLRWATWNWHEEVRRLLKDKGGDEAVPQIEKGAIRFKDAIGRKYAFPFHLCQTWVVSIPSSILKLISFDIVCILGYGGTHSTSVSPHRSNWPAR